MDSTTYYVTRLAGPKVAGRRVGKGDALQLTERQARAELIAGALTEDKAKVDDPFSEAAAKAVQPGDTRAAAAGDHPAPDADTHG